MEACFKSVGRNFPICHCQCRINHVAKVGFATALMLFKIMIQITEKVRLYFCKKVWLGLAVMESSTQPLSRSTGIE